MIFDFRWLVHHKNVQSEVRESIKILIKRNGKWCFEAVMEISCVDMIVEGEVISTKLIKDSSLFKNSS